MWCNAKIRLANEPRPVKTKTGTKMVSAFGFADVESDNGLPVALTAFGKLSDELRKYGKGDALRVTGSFRENTYEKDGETKKNFQITLDALAGVKRAKPVHAEPYKRKEDSGPEFNDELNF